MGAIYALTDAAAAVCDCEGRRLAAYPETAQLSEVQMRVPIVRGGTEVGSILLEAAAPSDEEIDHRRLGGAARLIELVVAIIGVFEPPKATHVPLWQRILRHIENNLASDLSVKALCRQFSVSKTELYRLLREEAPGGVAAYIRGKRLQKACALLRDTDIPVWKIAETVGYKDHDYFMRLFKKEIGISAAKYRKGETPIIHVSNSDSTAVIKTKEEQE